MLCDNDRGFSLIELAVVVLVFGIIIGFSVPPLVRFGRTNALHGAAENLAARIRLSREKALSTGVDEHYHVSGLFSGYSYAVHPYPGPDFTYYSLPTGVKFAPPDYSTTFFMYKNGRSSASVVVRLTNGRADTASVSVQLSGLVTVY